MSGDALHPPRVVLRQGDLTEIAVDAMVNAANAALAPGGGVCGAVHARGGPAIARECAALGGCATGDAVATTAGDLPARWVIHAVGPVWRGGGAGEEALLASCHRRALEVAAGLGARSVAFPAISTGIYGYPVERAAPVALAAALAARGVEEVRFVLFSAGDLEVYRRALDAAG
jgi:O-acetyl-ADP-ribose deacetylase (regulator of RNase III)